MPLCAAIALGTKIVVGYSSLKQDNTHVRNMDKIWNLENI
jgi:hypothetical protein